VDKSAPFLTATAWCLLGPAVLRNVMLTAKNPWATTAASTGEEIMTYFSFLNYKSYKIFIQSKLSVIEIVCKIMCK